MPRPSGRISLLLFMPWAMIGALGFARTKFLPHRRIGAQESCVQHHGKRNVQFLEQPSDAQVAPGDRVLPERFVHEIRIAARKVRPKDRTLSETEHLDEQSEADRDLLSAGPGRDRDRIARKSGHRVDCVLRQAAERQVNRPKEQPGDEAEPASLRRHAPECVRRISRKIAQASWRPVPA